MKVIPLGIQVLVEIANNETKGGLFIPSAAREKQSIGTVLGIGSAVKIDVKEGEKVIFRKFAGNEVNEENTQLLIDEREVLGKIQMEEKA